MSFSFCEGVPIDGCLERRQSTLSAAKNWLARYAVRGNFRPSYTTCKPGLTRTRLSITLVDADRQFFKSQVGLPKPYDTTRETPLTHSFCQHIVAKEDISLVNDAKTDPLVCDNLAVRDLGVIVAYLGVPLRMPDGSVLGSLCAIDRKDREWAPEDISALWDLAQIVMDEILLRLKMAERREPESKEKRHDELYNELKGTIVAVHSILKAVKARLDTHGT